MPSTRESPSLIYRLGWTGFRLIFKTAFRAKIYNPERLPDSGPVLVASNHESFLDPPLIGSAVERPIHYLARATLFRPPIGSWLLPRWNAVPVDREGGSGSGVRTMLQKLEEGRAMLIFPEGTRTPDGRFLPAQSGVGLIVLKSNAPVLPTRVFGTYRAWGKGGRLRPAPIAVKFGRLIDFAPERAEATTCSKARVRQIYQEVADRIMRAIAELQPHRDIESFPF